MQNWGRGGGGGNHMCEGVSGGGVGGRLEGTALLFECGELWRRSIVTPVAAVPHAHIWLPLRPHRRAKARRVLPVRGSGLLPNSSQRQCQFVYLHLCACISVWLLNKQFFNHQWGEQGCEQIDASKTKLPTSWFYLQIIVIFFILEWFFHFLHCGQSFSMCFYLKSHFNINHHLKCKTVSTLLLHILFKYAIHIRWLFTGDLLEQVHMLSICTVCCKHSCNHGYDGVSSIYLSCGSVRCNLVLLTPDEKKSGM